MSEMVERVAAAIYAGYGIKKTKVPHFWKAMAERQARAAIEAMRQPTEAMVEDANLYTGDNSESYHIDQPLRAATYTAMIDAALK